jgi:spore coat protein SA
VIILKIALICTEKLPVPPIAGGAIQIYIEGILPELSKYHDVTVFGVKHDSLPDEEVINGVKYIRVSTSEEDKNEYIRNVKLRLNEDYDLVHIFNRPRWVESLSKGLPKTKFSLSLHNEMFNTKKIPADMAIACINRVEFISTVSKFIADGVRKLYPIANNKLHTVYSGVSVDLYKPVMSIEGAQNKINLKRKFGIEDKKVVIFVGRLSVKKGVDKLVDTMKIVMDLRSDVALVVVGSKWYGANTEDKYTQSIVNSSKMLNGPIVFTGFLPPSEIPAYYNMGDVFVCPSQWEEPLARVHYEAMAAGLPIVTTNRGGNAEVVKGFGNGFVIDDFSNPEAFATRIIELLDNPLKASEMGLKGRAIAEEKYNWNRVADDVLSLFKGTKNSVMVEETVDVEESVFIEEPVLVEETVDVEKPEPIFVEESVWVENPVIVEETVDVKEPEPIFAEEPVDVKEQKKLKKLKSGKDEKIEYAPKITKVEGIYIIPKSKKPVKVFEPEDEVIEVVQRKRKSHDPSIPPIVAYYLEKCKHYLD